MTPPRAHLYLPHVSFYYHNLPECQALSDSGYHKKVLSHVIQSDSYPPEKTLIYDTGLRHWFTTLVYDTGLRPWFTTRGYGQAYDAGLNIDNEQIKHANLIKGLNLACNHHVLLARTNSITSLS